MFPGKCASVTGHRMAGYNNNYQDIYRNKDINIIHQELIKNITTTSKFVILKSFSDFERYKGTIKFIRSIGGAFSDVISYYELFIDYDENYVNPVGKYLIIIDRTNITNSSYFTISSPKQKYLIWFNEDDNGIEPHLNEYYNIEIKYSSLSTSAEITREIITALNNTENKDFYVNVNGTDIIELYQSQHGEVLENPTAGTTKLAIKVLQTGKKNGSWILRPRPIYIHPKMSTITEPFSYLDAYNKIPTLLVPVEQLDQLRERNEIILPTKSNIILMDYTSTIDGEYFTIFKY